MRLSIPVTLLCSLVQISCKLTSPPCSDQVGKGDTLDVEIVERWDESSRFAFSEEYSDPQYPATCNRNDVKPGQRFSLKLTEVSSGSCTDPLCPVDFPTKSEPDESQPAPGFDELCRRTDRKIRVSDTCEIGRYVSLRQGNPGVDAFDEPQEGKAPPTILVLQYTGVEGAVNLVCDSPASLFPPDAEASPGIFVCTDYWVVSVKKR